VVDAGDQQLTTHREPSLATTDHHSRPPHDRNLSLQRTDGDSLGANPTTATERLRTRNCKLSANVC
jgi:hypothetical protein